MQNLYKRFYAGMSGNGHLESKTPHCGRMIHAIVNMPYKGYFHFSGRKKTLLILLNQYKNEKLLLTFGHLVGGQIIRLRKNISKHSFTSL